MIEILRTGSLATIQDLGRPGLAHLGVGRCGAADRGALALANRLVGNPDDAAGIEVTFGGFALLALDAVTVALTGAACVGPLGWGASTTIRAGQVVELGPPAAQLRSYLAVRGGIDVPAVLGSRSTDLLGGLGPDPLRPGVRLAIGRPSGTVSGEVAVPRPRPSSLLVVPGPRIDWFTDDALSQLTSQDWTVRADSNRIGVRLDGTPLTRTRNGELPTEATLPGALQIPPNGRPILLGPDAPVTGGYPVLAVLADSEIDAAGQLRPGDPVHFRLWPNRPISRL